MIRVDKAVKKSVCSQILSVDMAEQQRFQFID